MRTVKNVLSLTALSAIIVFSVNYVASFGLHIGLPENRTNLSMSVPDVNGLVAGSSVLLRGVRIGKVTQVSTSASAATISFYVEGVNGIPANSDVRLENLSALGETYIALLPRTTSGPMLTDGQHIAAELIAAPPSISKLATSVVRVLNQLDPGQLERTVAEADTALPDPGQVLPNLARASTLLRNMTVSMDGRGQQVLGNVQTLLRNADWVGPTLAEGTPALHDMGGAFAHMFKGVFNVVAWNNPENMKLFRKFLDRFQHFLDINGPDVKVLAQALRPQVQGIGGALMNFDTGQILSNALSGIPEEGAITLHVRIPDR